MYGKGQPLKYGASQFAKNAKPQEPQGQTEQFAQGRGQQPSIQQPLYAQPPQPQQPGGLQAQPQQPGGLQAQPQSPFTAMIGQQMAAPLYAGFLGKPLISGAGWI